MAGRFARSLALAMAPGSVIRADKELLWLPVLSVMALLLLVGSFVAPAVALGGFDAAVAPGDPPTGFALVAIFFNTALVGAAMIGMDGGNPTLRDGLAIARSRVSRIFGYAVIAATVGLLLQSLEQRVLLAIVAFVVLSALQATMQGVYSAALYRHATEPGRPMAGFAPEIMAVAFKPKT